MEAKTRSLPPARDVQRLRRQRQSCTLDKHGKEIRVKAVTSEGKGRRLVVVIGPSPGLGIPLPCLLTMRFTHNEGEQAWFFTRRVPNIRIMGPLSLINEGEGARLFGTDDL